MNTILPIFHNFHLKISIYKFSKKNKAFKWSHIYTLFLFTDYLITITPQISSILILQETRSSISSSVASKFGKKEADRGG